MSKRLHIATVGIHANERIDYVVTKKGADKIALVYSEKNAEDAESIRIMFVERGLKAVSVKVEPWDYHCILARILEIAVDHLNYEIEYNVSCGTRVMTAAAHQAALLTDSKVYFILGDYDEQLDKIVDVQPISVIVLTEPKRNILARIDALKGQVSSQKELGSRTRLKVSSVSKHLRELEDSGYITRERCGRATSVRLTGLGRVILKLKQYKKGKACVGDTLD